MTFLKRNHFFHFLVQYALLPLFAFSGLALGALFFLVLDLPSLGRDIWFFTLAVGGTPIVYKTLQGLFQGRFASDVIAMLAIFSALLLNQALAGAVIVLMQSGGEAIEAFGLQKATSSLTTLLKRAPRLARRRVNQTMEEIDVRDVVVGDILIVRPGDLVPVDGTIIEGSSEIDESAITGEPLARTKSVGEHLLSGSINVVGIIAMRAEKTSKESQYAKIIELVKNAQENKAPLQRIADKYAIIFTPLTLFIGFLGYYLTHDPTTVLAVLVVATPCPLIIATPLAVICGINRAANAGIIVKGGAAIEQVASSQAIVFDKTGTITFGMPYVEEVVSLQEESAEEVLLHAAILDQFSSHSIAKAIVHKASTAQKELPLPKLFQEVPGQGVEGEIDAHRFAVGSFAFIEKEVDPKEFSRHQTICAHYFEKNKLLVYVAKDHHCIGFIVLSDQIRPEVPTLIQRLHMLGMKEIEMFTGDSKKNALVIARQAGIHSVRAGLMPEQKVSFVQELKNKYKNVIMVGDGINDAPALATATVGIAMGAHGTAISAEAADIVLLIDDLSKVADIISFGRRMMQIAKQSIFIGLGLSLFLMILAAQGLIAPAMGALLQELIDIAVILNALRARGS